jgi:O-antigen/teichoic acid export membrane protein
VNRYVAQYRAAGDALRLSQAVSSVAAIQLFISAAALVATVVLAATVPLFLADRLGADLQSARWVILLLGCSVAVQMALDVARGVITGCHRWDLHNLLQSGSYALSVAGMLLMLVSGGGIISLALMYLLGVVTGEVTRMVMARRVCPELELRARHASWKEGWRMFRFGSKTMVIGVLPFIIMQAITFGLTAALGPAALAVFSRPFGLLRIVETLQSKASAVLVPIIGSLPTGNDLDTQRALWLSSTKWSAAFVYPLMLGIALLGDALLQLWMGDGYQVPGLLWLLAGCYALTVAQYPAVTVLIGMNMHGRIGLWLMAACLLLLTVGITAMQLTSWSIYGAGLTVAITMLVTYGIMAPAFVCKKLAVSVGAYVRVALWPPLLATLPLAVILFCCSSFFSTQPLQALLVAALVGSPTLAIGYWTLLLDSEQKQRIRSRLQRLRGA